MRQLSLLLFGFACASFGMFWETMLRLDLAWWNYIGVAVLFMIAAEIVAKDG